MKFRITESDIHNMVTEAIKNLMENDIRMMVGDKQAHVVADAYEKAFGEKPPFMRPNMFELMQQRYDNATPQERQNFETVLNGGEIEPEGEPIDLFLDDEF